MIQATKTALYVQNKNLPTHFTDCTYRRYYLTITQITQNRNNSEHEQTN